MPEKRTWKRPEVRPLTEPGSRAGEADSPVRNIVAVSPDI
jgi:hypothetical protein